MNRIICVAAFLVGLVAVSWVGAGYVGTSALALTMTAIIGAVYVTGAAELRRFHCTTGALARALDGIPADLSHPDEWLRQLPPSVQNPVRLRIEGERAGLPGPAMTPYLVGLLVLLGMLGTFLGMVVTLNGAVIALESTTNLEAIRSSLAAPVRGLGVAFGTSVAGVAASAMLGLISAVCRRERMRVAQLLETRIGTSLRGFSLAHQRQETFKALQLQARVLPELVDKLQAMMEQMDRQGRELNERLVAGQERFHRDAREVYSELASSVDKSLRTSLGESARLAGETIRPAVAETMDGIARETSALRARLAEAVQAQLEGISTRFDGSVTRVAETWNAALATHERTSEELSRGMQGVLGAFGETFERRSAALLDSVETAHASLRSDLAATTSTLAQDTAALQTRLADTVERQLDGVSTRFGDTAATVAANWASALASHERTSEHLAKDLRKSLETFAENFAQRSAALVAAIGESTAAQQARQAAADEARLVAQTQALESMAASLQQEWHAAGAQTLARQEQICTTLGETAHEIAAAARAQASGTIEEVARLMHTAAEAPRAAAEVIGQLRQELSASIARDNGLLEERSRIMETLATLLSAINHASTEQRSAIDALVASATGLLECAGSRFAANIEAESARIADVAGEISGGAAEVASLGEAFGAAVQRFAESGDRMMVTLARIEGALDKSLARSDEQLAYYVAQAREIIDLSIMSQRQIVEDLQQLSGKQASLVGEG
ncbi:DUF802 domain-containing protein [Aromatoleum petrolei]|uniref:DUF802 domain-containing protein n=1 Tax=Aromatoleum petrolei TaxID=76116 RepID=A0ABX1MQU9_9RHOO|nr:DUF802 domain-containing protein [Aromatoleum petrolei]NMF87522.1 DUF802 domain-containing protein [Aromatoleum petrolei]QTQ38619.1 putative protein DUF802 [Aromatoleum petrolei]